MEQYISKERLEIYTTILKIQSEHVMAAYMGWDKVADGTKLDPTKAKLPQISNGDWKKVVQRVVGQSIISFSLNTTFAFSIYLVPL
ncbi:hypothetical protein [Photorhabdus viridis]|uniref:hypothetical protein n=1 Tax=Photorhabdus viridis TaxID=3163327 RepID=UPI003306F6C1